MPNIHDNQFRIDIWFDDSYREWCSRVQWVAGKSEVEARVWSHPKMDVVARMAAVYVDGRVALLVGHEKTARKSAPPEPRQTELPF